MLQVVNWNLVITYEDFQLHYFDDLHLHGHSLWRSRNRAVGGERCHTGTRSHANSYANSHTYAESGSHPHADSGPDGSVANAVGGNQAVRDSGKPRVEPLGSAGADLQRLPRAVQGGDLVDDPGSQYSLSQWQCNPV